MSNVTELSLSFLFNRYTINPLFWGGVIGNGKKLEVEQNQFWSSGLRILTATPHSELSGGWD